MSERLTRLESRIGGLFVPVGQLHKAAKKVASAMVLVATPGGDVRRKETLLARALESIDKLGDILGEDVEVVTLLRAMHAIATAIVWDRPEPDDEELGLGGSSGSSRPARSSRSSSKCFVATAACGTERAPDVVRLREFRDAVLRRSVWGRGCVRLYELVSPPIARLIARSQLARAVVRWLVVRPASWVAAWAAARRDRSR